MLASHFSTRPDDTRAPHLPAAAPDPYYCGKVQRSHLALAALATVAVPGIDIYQARTAPAPEGFEAAYVLDAEGRTWVVRAPLDAAAGASLEAEASFLRSMEDFVASGALPFVIPKPQGFAPLIEGGRAIVYPHVPGNPLHLDRLTPGPGAAASLGRAIGAIHSLPVRILEDSAFPSYTTAQYRDRRLAELDEGATSGLVPVALLRRWEAALENVALWRFAPVITHTNLSEESVIMAHGQVSGIVDWSSVQVGDPADDLAWLVAAAPMESVDSIFEAYQMRRSDSLDPHLIDRALLGSELALLKWLLHGVRKNDESVIEDAQAMLRDLVEATTGSTDTGSFTISSLPAPVDRAPVERMIGDTGVVPTRSPSSVGSASSAAEPATTGTESVLAASGTNSISDESAGSSTGSPRSVNQDGGADADVSEQDDSAHTGSEYTEFEHAESVSLQVAEPEVYLDSSEFSLPDYDKVHPPKPYADTPTEVLTALPDPETGEFEAASASSAPDTEN